METLLELLGQFDLSIVEVVSYLLITLLGGSGYIKERRARRQVADELSVEREKLELKERESDSDNLALMIQSLTAAFNLMATTNKEMVANNKRIVTLMEQRDADYRAHLEGVEDRNNIQREFGVKLGALTTEVADFKQQASAEHSETRQMFEARVKPIREAIDRFTAIFSAKKKEDIKQAFEAFLNIAYTTANGEIKAAETEEEKKDLLQDSTKAKASAEIISTGGDEAKGETT